ncbi:MAG TPA: hybrid sensor histidine kinase/response regulator [Polyangia bacterium]|nr:hybrid sensor histidine kinase/response regulator [Polyangia bacterium]
MHEERDKTRVLLVEDNAGDARLMREYLAEVPEQPFVVTTAGTLREAEAAVRGQDVVLLDLSLPDAHGIDTVSRMAESAEGAPIIVLTGNTDQDMALRAVAKGADDYLLKSEITPSLIARTILYAVERRRRARQLMALEVSRAESEHSARQARFLADLSSAFAIALDVDDVVQSLIKVAVPELGDYCGIDLVGGDQRLRRAAVRADGSRSAVDALASSTPTEIFPSFQAVQGRRIVEVPDIPAALDTIPAEPLQRKAVLSLGLQSGLVLPLLARDRVVGAMMLAMKAGRQFDAPARALAEEVARRAALAVDNAMLYRAMKRALRARDEMLAIVSHDLRNPLLIFGLTLQSIRRSLDTGRTPTAETLAKGTRAIARMERLINDLLDVARIDAGTFVVDKTPTDLPTLLREAVEQHGPLAADKGIRLQMTAPADLLIEADRHRLMQVMANLIGNAIKFTPEGGAITVSCGRAELGARVVVADSGPGIDADSLPHVFDRFYQTDAHSGGAGLGLTIAKGIVDAHGGSIGVDSQPGQGARFWFELPTRPDASQSAVVA